MTKQQTTPEIPTVISSPPARSENEPASTPPSPIIPLLKDSVAHMQANNGFVRETTNELIKLNAMLTTLLRMMYAMATCGLLLLAGLFVVLYEQARVSGQTELQLNQQVEANLQLARVVDKIDATYLQGQETKEALNEQPTIMLKPADTSDPTSRPMLIVSPKSATPLHPRPAPKGVEIPVELPR